MQVNTGGKKMKSLRLRVLAQTLPFLLIAPVALAQAPAKAPSRGQAAAALNQPAQPGAAHYTRQQIDQLVAPIALYPDQILSQVLMAATYPQQVVEAAQWLKEQGHGELKGDALAQALEPLPWDPSVKALTAFPQIIEMMSDHIEWTETLGVAFATQQAEVMSRVQALRQLAMKSGKLKQVRHLTVKQEGSAIAITSAEPDRVYVPIYNPSVVYGQWADREFPPVYLPPPQGFAGETIEPGFEVSTGYAIVRPLWGWSRPDWRANRITVNTTEYTRITRNAQVGPGNVWRHNGPVVLVSPTVTSRTTVTTTNIPAGAVAPARAAAVVALPQRAAAQPNLIQTQTTTAQPGQTTPTTTAQPTTTPSGQKSTTTAQPSTTTPSTAQPGQTSPTTTAQPTTTPSGQTPTTTARPTTTQPDKTPTTTAQPSAPQPGKTPAASTAQPERATGKSAQPSEEQAGASRPGAGETEKKQPTADEKTAKPSAQPGKTEASKTEAPAEHKAGEAHTRPGEAARNRGKTPPAAGQPTEHVPAPAATKAPEPAAPRGPEHAGATPPVGTSEQPARAPEQAGAKPPAATEQPSRAPEHAGAKPPAGPTPTGGGPAAGHEPQRTNAPPANAQGTSAPLQPGPQQAGPGAQRPHEPGARPPGQRPEQDEKKER
jgi:hypothetical protein